MNYTTVKSQLPYHYVPTPKPHTIEIHNVKGQVLTVTRQQIENQLMRDDIDVHRRRMYEGALDALNKAGAK